MLDFKSILKMATVSLKINKMVAGNPWVKENIKELEELNYYKK